MYDIYIRKGDALTHAELKCLLEDEDAGFTEEQINILTEDFYIISQSYSTFSANFKYCPCCGKPQEDDESEDK